MKRILVIRGGAIGDFVLTLPAIKLLRDNFPAARLEILANQHIAALAEGRGYAAAVRSIEDGALASFFAKDGELDRDLCGYFASFDLVVSYLFDPEETFASNLRRSGARTYLACSPKIEESEHASVQLARPLEQLDLSLGEPAAALFPSSADQNAAKWFHKQTSPPVVAIHPGSGSKKKNWRPSEWLALSVWLVESGRVGSLLIIGGEADREQMAFLRSRLTNCSAVFAEDLALPLLAAVLQKCALFVGHDSGISHIAAAVGTPCLLLFGPSDPAIWAPANPNVQVLRAPSETMSQLRLSAVKQALEPILAQFMS